MRLQVSILLIIDFIFPLSLGCKAIFLLGGKSRQDEPLAMFLRSGDVVLMAGEARECFHGEISRFTHFLRYGLLIIVKFEICSGPELDDKVNLPINSNSMMQ